MWVSIGVDTSFAVGVFGWVAPVLNRTPGVVTEGTAFTRSTVLVSSAFMWSYRQMGQPLQNGRVSERGHS